MEKQLMRITAIIAAAVLLTGCQFAGAFAKERAAYRAGQLVNVYCLTPVDRTQVRQYMDQRIAPRMVRVYCDGEIEGEDGL